MRIGCLVRVFSPGDGNPETVPNFSEELVEVAVRIRSGQVAQVVERSPEKAGVGGSTPSLATKSFTFNRLPRVLDPIHRVDIS